MIKKGELSSILVQRVFPRNKSRSLFLPAVFLVFALLSLTSCDSASSSSENAGVGDGGYPFYVYSAVHWDAAVKTINRIGKNKSFTIFIGGNFSIPGYSANTFKNTGITVTIRGSGYSVSLASGSQGSLLYIGSSQTVILQDLALVGRNPNDRALVYVNGGSFTMRGSASVQGNSNSYGSGYGSSSGGGVYVGSGGSFTMQDSASVSGNTSISGGGGVFVDGGGSGSFTMSGSSSVSSNSGGGVFVNGGSFTMQDSASVSGNTGGGGGGNGGGVFVNGGSFTMLGGTVQGNSGHSGGGVFVGGSGSGGGNFTMQGGTVQGNTSSSGGGGVYVGSGGSFNKSGGTVYGSDASPSSLANSATNGVALFSSGTVIDFTIDYNGSW